MIDARVPRISLYSRVRRVGGALVVSGRMDTDESQELEDVAEEIWQSIDGRRTVREITAHLAQQYGAEEAEVADDVVAFLNDLAVRGLIEWSAGGPRDS